MFVHCGCSFTAESGCCCTAVSKLATVIRKQRFRKQARADSIAENAAGWLCSAAQQADADATCASDTKQSPLRKKAQLRQHNAPSGVQHRPFPKDCQPEPETSGLPQAACVCTSNTTLSRDSNQSCLSLHASGDFVPGNELRRAACQHSLPDPQPYPDASSAGLPDSADAAVDFPMTAVVFPAVTGNQSQ